MTDETPYSLQLFGSIQEIDKDIWDALANPNKMAEPINASYNPFLRHDFLSALESSKSVGEGTGWYPRHAVLSEGQNAQEQKSQIVAAAPLYLKAHSQGEYVFDHGWANAFEHAGGAYYPKLQNSIPFTPATGPRLLAKSPQMRDQLANALGQAGEQLGVSSVHSTFINPTDRVAFEGAGFLIRTDQQFHFENQEFSSFDDFLATLASRKRKAIKKERKLALENSIEIRWLTGSEISEADWDAFFEFYIDTGARKWGQPYLTREFFSQIGAKMAEDILLIFAYREGRAIAGAINFIGGDTLFGRHWGCIEDHPFLHFEVCYYQAIDFAIQKGLKFVEAGAQGAHKLARGYLPKTTYSAHYVGNSQFRDAVERFLKEERKAVERENELLEQASPFKQNQPLNQLLSQNQETPSPKEDKND